MGTKLNALRVATSTLMSRLGLAALSGDRFNGKRKYYDVFGYKDQLSYADFLLKYERQDITSRIIDAPPKATWSNPPTFVDPAMQTAWDALNKKHNLWSKLDRVDRLARLGEYALLVIGTNAGTLELQMQRKAQELLYVRPVGMNNITQIDFEMDSTNARFGMPKMYTVAYTATVTQNVKMDSTTNVHTQKDIKVHHSRSLHITENALSDDNFSMPIIAKVFNLLDDLLKITGGTAEMFWTSADRGMQVDIDKDMDLQPDDAAALTEEIEEYIHGLRRFIRTRGVEIKNLGSDVASPQAIFEIIMSLISGTTGIPRRILMGSEAGQLASEQDRANWAERIEERRVLYAEPVILRPFVQKLQEMNLMPEGDVEVVWPSAFIMSPLEASMVMAQKARAIGNMARQTGNKVTMQITSREEAREILGLEGDLSESDLMTPKVDANRQPIPEQPAKTAPDTTDVVTEGGAPMEDQ